MHSWKLHKVNLSELCCRKAESSPTHQTTHKRKFGSLIFQPFQQHAGDQV